MTRKARAIPRAGLPMVDASLDQKRTTRKSNYNHKNQTNLDDANGRLALHISIYEVLGAVDQAVQERRVCHRGKQGKLCPC
jgi:hypothetical protein